MSRGYYGINRSNTWLGAGQGSFFGHTPGDVENELDQLHGEIMQFGKEVQAWAGQLDEKVRAEPDIHRLQMESQEADQKSKRPLGVDPRNPMVRENQNSPERIAAVKKAHELKAKYDEAFIRRRAAFSQWDNTAWTPFWNGWQSFYEEKKHIPLQNWPLSGTWDRVQDYRKKFIDTRNGAPFAPAGPAPIDPSERKDPSITGGVEELLKIGKYALIGVLAIGGIVALSSVASNVRKGQDPIQRYAELYRKGRKSGRAAS